MSEHRDGQVSVHHDGAASVHRATPPIATAPKAGLTPLGGRSAWGHALAGTLFFLTLTMTGVQDVVALLGGGRWPLLALHLGTTATLVWTGAHLRVLNGAIAREAGTLVLRPFGTREVARRALGPGALGLWAALLALHLALGAHSGWLASLWR